MVNISLFQELHFVCEFAVPLIFINFTHAENRYLVQGSGQLPR